MTATIAVRGNLAPWFGAPSPLSSQLWVRRPRSRFDRPGRAPSAHAVVRVDELGHRATGSKVAYLMSPSAMSGPSSSRRLVRNGHLHRYRGTSTGRWNGATHSSYPLTFTPAGGRRYRHHRGGGHEPGLLTALPRRLLCDPVERGALANSLSFYQNERDGPDYIRRPTDSSGPPR